MTAEWDAWVGHVRDELVPKMADSAVVVSLVPRGDTDVKFAVELGLAIMLDKPILAVIPNGVRASRKLRKIADVIIAGAPGDEGFNDRLQAALDQMLGRRR